MVIFIDALNQLDNSNQSHNLTWLPLKIPSNISIIVSCLPSDCLDILKERKTTNHISVTKLTDEDRNEIISQTLGKYQKKLTNNQNQLLLSKKGTDNPLFLTMACEELRIFGDFDRLEQKIKDIADDVPSFLDQILSRLENEYGKELVQTTLGLLQSSRFGLLEEELLEMNPNLSRYQWGEFFLSIKFYLRPIGGSNNEKILDFFHRQFAKAVEKRYITQNEQLHIKLNEILANYFLSKISPGGIRSFNGSSEYSRGYSEVIYHLFHSNQKNSIEILLTSLHFIEKKCLLGFTFDLISDYLLVSSSKEFDSIKNQIQPYQEFCMSNTHFMDEFPYTIVQMAVNQSDLSPLSKAGKQLHNYKQNSLKKQKSTNNDQLKSFPLLTWINKPTQEKNKQEYRKFNIGARANCSRGSPDEKYLCVGDIFGRLKLYNAKTSEEIAILLQSNTRITSIDISSDGKYVIAATNHFIFFIDILKKSIIHQISLANEENTNKEILCVCFSKKIENNNNYKLICGSDDNILYLIQIQLNNKIEPFSIKEIHKDHKKGIFCCKYLPNNDEILSGDGNKNIILSNENGDKKISFSGHSKAVKGLAIPSHGNWFISCSQDRLINIWDLKTRKKIISLEGHSDMVESCDITNDDQFIISGSWDKRVYLWDINKIFLDINKRKNEKFAQADENLSNQENFAILGEHAHFLNDVHCFGNHSVVSSSADMTVKLFHLPNESLELFKQNTEGFTDHHTELVCGMDYDPIHSFIATGSWDKHVKLLNGNDGKQIQHWKNHTKRVNDVCFAPKSFDFLVSGSMDHTVKLWDLNSFENTKTFVGHTAAVMAVCVSHDDRFIASGCAGRKIKFWDVDTGNCIDTIDAHSSWVDTLQFSKTSRMLASASVDGEAKVWNTDNGSLLAHLRKHSAPILDVQWTKNDEYLITVGEDWLIRIWKTGTWSCVRVISGHKHEVTASCVLDEVPEICDIFNCDTLIATSSADQTIRFWNYLSGEQLWIYCGVNAFSYLIYVGNKTFAAGDSRGGVHLLSFKD